jgi:hypothetical protein
MTADRSNPANELRPTPDDFDVPVEGIGEDQLGEVAFGRNRFLRRLAATVFTLVSASVVRASPAYACTLSSPPPLCGPSKQCCCCTSGGWCCSADCTNRYECGSQGWYVYTQSGSCVKKYFCRDFWSGGQRCICRQYIGLFCP